MLTRILKNIGWVLLLIFNSAISYANNNTINFLNWGDYIAPNVIPDYSRSSDTKVNQNYFDSEDMLRALLTMKNNMYDLAVLNDADVIGESKAGLLQPIDKSKLSNYQYINKALYKIASQSDPNNSYGIVYSYGTTGIAYNEKMIAKVLGPNVKIDSWKFLFDPIYLKKLQSCGISYSDDSDVVFSLTKFYLGMDPNSENPKDLNTAANYLMTLRPYITYFDDNRYIYDLAGGNICIAIGYSGDVLRAQQLANQSHSGVDIRYVIPKEGTMVWFDMLVIPKNAPHPKAALKFINYLMQAQNMGAISNYLMQPNAMDNTTPYLTPTLIQAELTQQDLTTKKLFTVHNPVGTDNALLSKLWFQVKYGVNLD
ncbi:MAG: bacterial extracellular solute-binding family protein [Gammaproteobacteria bacterium]|jgi:spermidine/putrescine-binding protein|nr:bacterial extracellular solute-binding family protein [Gammaproteobacteria bacterium]